MGKSAEMGADKTDLPSVEMILADLEANGRLIQSFRGGGAFVVESPKIDGKKRKFRGRLKFQRPNSLAVQGTKLGGAVIVFRMISVGEQFLMEFPGNREESFYQLEGEEFERVDFSVSPSDIVREMFLPEDWSSVRRRNLQVDGLDEETGVLLVEMQRRDRLHRRMEMQRAGGEDGRWVITRDMRFDSDGEVLAITELTNYSSKGDALFPGKVDAFFPTEDTRMTFMMRNIVLNAEIDASTFDILARARELNLELRSPELSD